MLQNIFSSTRIMFNSEIIEINELKKMYYYFGRENFFVTHYLCLFYAPYFAHTLHSIEGVGTYLILFIPRVWVCWFQLGTLRRRDGSF